MSEVKVYKGFISSRKFTKLMMDHLVDAGLMPAGIYEDINASLTKISDTESAVVITARTVTPEDP